MRGLALPDDRLDHVLASVGVAFDAAVAREEDDAAADLAFSLLQDRDFGDVLHRGGLPWAVLLSDGVRADLTMVGADFLGAGALLVPFDRAVVVRLAQGPAPTTSSATLLQVLRGWARDAREATICAGQRAWAGTVSVCGRDYVELRVRRENVLIARRTIEWVRAGGDS